MRPGTPAPPVPAQAAPAQGQQAVPATDEKPPWWGSKEREYERQELELARQHIVAQKFGPNATNAVSFLEMEPQSTSTDSSPSSQQPSLRHRSRRRLLDSLELA